MAVGMAGHGRRDRRHGNSSSLRSFHSREMRGGEMNILKPQMYTRNAGYKDPLLSDPRY